MATTQLVDKLELSRLLIFNSRDKEVSNLLTKAGIDTDYLNEGKVIYQEAVNLCENQKKELKEISHTYDEFYAARDDAREDYEITLKMVKALSRGDRSLQNRLQLSNGRAFALDGWIENAEDFYDRLLIETEFLKKLERFNLIAERIEEERKTIQNLNALFQQLNMVEEETEEEITRRNKKIEALQEYCFEFKEIAKIALSNKPKLMKKLGILT